VVVAFYRLLVKGKSPEFRSPRCGKYTLRSAAFAVLVKYVIDHIAEIAEDSVRNWIIEHIPDPLPRL